MITMMDVMELHDEENVLLQMQDRWENYGTGNGIVDSDDPFTIQGAPRFELTEQIDRLLSHALTEDENLLLRQTLGMGCKQRSMKELASQRSVTVKALNKELVRIIHTLRMHDDSILLWKYLHR